MTYGLMSDLPFLVARDDTLPIILFGLALNQTLPIVLLGLDLNQTLPIFLGRS
jgi:hypothetical protein